VTRVCTATFNTSGEGIGAAQCVHDITLYTSAAHRVTPAGSEDLGGSHLAHHSTL
jgi:hypothetical protein